MNTPQSNEETVLEQALNLGSAEARENFLKAACGGDEALAQRIRSLLQAHERSGKSPTPPDAPGPAAPVPGFDPGPASAAPPEQTGDYIGRYKLLQELGSGGCGVVYMAEQEEPVRRRVALKVIKLGMDTKQVVARFNAERQALALMDHPNIAKVLDGGSTAAGRPYFVMELVRGIRITDYFDRNNLSTADRLKLFIKVCQAVQHAHQKGIIHRDLKPSNILVTLHDGEPVPKVIDFGIAKATEGRLTDQTLFTAFEQFIGTPAYMSPEQAELSGLDIDTRSDIYSLGVLLYELLTGKTPFDPRSLAAAGLDEIRRIIREEEPARPSTRVSTMLEAERTTVARHRQSDPPRLVHLLRGDLDWIVMKSLEKDRTRRYETANALAADIQRHLDNEPVVARPPSPGYRLRKMVRRNRLAVAAVVAIAVALTLGITMSTVQAVRARRAQAQATTSAAEARTQAARADQAALAASQSAEENRQRLVRLTVDNGVRLMNEGHALRSLPWLIEALRLDAGSPERERVHRVRIDSVLRHSPRLLHLLSPKGGFADYAEFSPDASKVLTASSPGQGSAGYAQVWDLLTGEPLIPPIAHDSRLVLASFSHDGRRIVTASFDGTARVWNAESGDPVSPPLVLGSFVTHVEFSPDDSKVLAATLDHAARLWDATTGAAVTPVIRHPNLLIRATLSPDARRIVTTGSDGRVRFSDATTGRDIPPEIRGTGDAWTARFSPDGRRLVTGHSDGTARIWDALTGEPLGPPMPHEDQVTLAAFSPDGKTLVTSTRLATRLWAASGSGLALQPMEIRHSLTDDWRPWRAYPMFSADGASLLAPSGKDNVRAFDLQTLTPLSPHLPHNGEVYHASFSPDARRVVTASADGTTRVWDLGRGSRAPRAISTGALVNRVPTSPDGTRVAFAGADHAVRLLEAGSRRPVGAAMPHAKSVVCMAFSNDGRHFATASLDGYARIWGVPSGDAVSPPLLPDSQPQLATALQFDPSGGRLAIAIVGGIGAGHQVRIWTVPEGTPTGAGIESESLIEHVAFSPDGRYIATAGSDRSARIWVIETGEPATPPLQHDGPVFAVAFSPDSRWLVSGSSDGAARVWDVATGQPITLPLMHAQRVLGTRFSDGGGELLTATESELWRWDLVPDPRPVGELNRWANVLAGRRVVNAASLVPVPRAELLDNWHRLATERPGRSQTEGRKGPVTFPWQSNSREERTFADTLPFRNHGPSPHPAGAITCIDLSPFANTHRTNEATELAGLPVGRHTWAGIDFELSNAIMLPGARLRHMGLDYPARIPGIPVGRKCSLLHFVHAGYAHHNALMATYVVRYANGHAWELPVTGDHVSNWRVDRNTAHRPGESKRCVVAWQGEDTQGPVQLHLASWENPRPDLVVESIELVSSEVWGSIFIAAISVE